MRNIEKELGNTGYVKFRDAEFSLQNIPRTELIGKIEDSLSILDKTLSELKDEDLKNEFPGLYGEKKYRSKNCCSIPSATSITTLVR
jgi:hypothetical protein